MRFFLLSAFFVVSAGKDITVKGFEKDNVLLPCDCSNRNLAEDFKWQVEEDKNRGVKRKVIFIKNDRTMDFKDNLSHRYETFFHNDRSNCSVLLKNITWEDQGKYSCRFHSPGYTHLHVNLVVFGTQIFQRKETGSNGGNLYICVVKLDSYNEPNIEWTLDGECLSDLNTTNSSTTYNLDEDTGLHYFHSRLETESNFTSDPQCQVNVTCQFATDKQTKDPENKSSPYFRILCKGVPVVLVLGLLLIWYLRGTSHGVRSEEDV